MFRDKRQVQSRRRELEARRRDGNEHLFFEEVGDMAVAGEFNGSNVSIREIFHEFVEDGREIVETFSRAMAGNRVNLCEAGINTGAFANITGQIIYSTVLAAYNQPSFLSDSLATTMPTEFDGEKIPGISGLGDHGGVVAENEPYPTVGVSEAWIETPLTLKRGFIVPITKEAIFYDRTHMVLDRARRVAEWAAINKEKRIIDLATGIVSLYKRNGSAAIATYGDNSGTHDWDNLAASNGLATYANIDAALQLFDGMTDPDTGEPIIVEPNQILIPSALKMTAASILNATEIRNTVSTLQTISANPLSGNDFERLSNSYVKARTSSATTWFIGDFKAAFAYMENWPITTSEAPLNSTAEFERDIAAQFKVSECGAAAVIDPRRVVKCTA